MSAPEEKRARFFFNLGNKREVPGGQEITLVRKSLWVCICGTSALRLLHVKQSSLVDKIMQLCVKRSRDPGSVVAVLSPNKFLSSVFIYAEVSQEQH